jgi:hemoglobin
MNTKSVGLLIAGVSLALLSLSASAETAQPTDAEQVAGIQKMCTDASADMQKRQAEKSLYDRLGGEQKIQTLARKIIEAHQKNPKISPMFANIDKAKVVQHVTEFLVVGTGGKGSYTGKDMVSVHRSMNITNGDFLAAGGDVQGVMKEMEYGANEIQEIVCALTSFVPVVVVQR